MTQFRRLIFFELKSLLHCGLAHFEAVAVDFQCVCLMAKDAGATISSAIVFERQIRDTKDVSGLSESSGPDDFELVALGGMWDLVGVATASHLEGGVVVLVGIPPLEFGSQRGACSWSSIMVDIRSSALFAPMTRICLRTLIVSNSWLGCAIFPCVVVVVGDRLATYTLQHKQWS